MKKLVMFDLDGTVLDTEKDLLLCANELFAKCGYPQIGMDRVKQANGKDAVGYMNTLMGGNASLLSQGRSRSSLPICPYAAVSQ